MDRRYKVLLLGDSIRLGYQEYVRTTLNDIADVYCPNDNSRFCQMTLRYFHDWARILSENWSFDFDVIHFNSGLWDVLRLSNEEECFNSPQQYCDLLSRIIGRMRHFYPNAKIIFATSTKVIEPGFEYGNKFAIRKNEDIKRYNEIAKLLMDNMGVNINDLWRISVEIGDSAMSDNVHYDTEKGVTALGGMVEKCIRNILKNEVKW